MSLLATHDPFCFVSLTMYMCMFQSLRDSSFFTSLQGQTILNLEGLRLLEYNDEKPSAEKSRAVSLKPLDQSEAKSSSIASPRGTGTLRNSSLSLPSHTIPWWCFSSSFGSNENSGEFLAALFFPGS